MTAFELVVWLLLGNELGVHVRRAAAMRRINATAVAREHVAVLFPLATAATFLRRF